MTSPSAAGSRWLVAMGVALALAGAVATWVLWTAYQKAAETRGWTATPCRVISSQVVPIKKSASANTLFQSQVRYRYQVEGVEHVSQRIKRDDVLTGDRDKAESLRLEYSPGQQLTCYVKPGEPSMAVLQHRGRGALFSIWFPLLIVYGGSVMAWRAWRKQSHA
jgi:hypothetical protein